MPAPLTRAQARQHFVEVLADVRASLAEGWLTPPDLLSETRRLSAHWARYLLLEAQAGRNGDERLFREYQAVNVAYRKEAARLARCPAPRRRGRR